MKELLSYLFPFFVVCLILFVVPFTLYYNRFFEMPKIDAKKQQIFFKTYCLCADVMATVIWL